MDFSRKPGQRWISEPEPELGLGILEEVDRFQVQIHFPASGERRRYAVAQAPIKRVRFQVGDSLRGAVDEALVVARVEDLPDGCLLYHGEDGRSLHEKDLSDSISFSKPEERLLQAQVDPCETFDLRFDALVHDYEARRSPVRGFVGGRIDLIPHQLYIASEVANRYLPRVLLADEVGLGKTIEACLIIHRLHLTGRAERVFVVVPETLVHQWFVELLRRFNLWFVIFDEARLEGVRAGAEVNPFLDEQRVICSTRVLAAHPEWADLATEARWDILVVDEAHHLEWSPAVVSPEYRAVERLAAQTPGLLLLTATPEQLGAAGHFARLRLLDPARYPSLERFLAEQANYADVAQVADKLTTAKKLTVKDVRLLENVFGKEDADFQSALTEARAGDRSARERLLADLIDRHGTGRVIFRNTREILTGFPKRRALPAPLKPRSLLRPEELKARLLREFDLDFSKTGERAAFDYRGGPRIAWLVRLLKDLDTEKVLLICRTKEKVEAIAEALQAELNVKVAVFHEELTLLQRDRNAAWFAEPDGARILLCSEIGSEGRNFQFAHHLVLFDLPLDPELLEQRIGRLDRIGQTTEIRIHIPYLEGSSPELLQRWHHEGLDGVEHSLRGGNAYTERFGREVLDLGRVYHEGTPEIRRKAEALIEASAAFRSELEERLRRGYDRLLSLNSFQPEVADEHIHEIRRFDADESLDNFMNRVFDHYGVEVEDLAPRTLHLSPGTLFIDVFPELPAEGTRVTFDRAVALGREDIQFITEDHPMVRGVIDLLVGSEQGNSSFGVWPDEGPPTLLLEAVFVLECVAPAHLHADRFLPPTPIRIVVNQAGDDVTVEYPVKCVRAHVRDEQAFRLHENPAIRQNLLPRLIREARSRVEALRLDLQAAGRTAAHRYLDGEARRLRELAKVNENVRAEEISIAEHFVEEVDRHIGAAHLRLDAVRLILRGPEI
jgi:ATP-dependent helicase HepA